MRHNTLDVAQHGLLDLTRRERGDVGRQLTIPNEIVTPKLHVYYKASATTSLKESLTHCFSS